MEQISRVPQARLVNTYRWKWKARLLASCGAMATSWPSLSTAPSPAARASARRCPTRARRRRLSPAQAGAGLLPLRGPARRSFADRRGAALARPSPARTHSPRPRGAARVPLGSYTSASSRHRPALGLGQHDVLRARGGYTLLLPATMLGVLDVGSAARAAAWPPGQSVWMMSVWTRS